MKSNSRINKQQQVQVVIRLKPESAQNRYLRCAYLASEDSNALVVEVPNKKEYFVFDAIADEDTSQFELYQSIGSQAVVQSLQGYNCCVFAYGQTGSGKTYSILGVLPDIVENIYAETRGILPRLLEDLFKSVKSSSDKFTIKCSYMEIYNQQIYDLLTQSFQALQIRQAPQKGVYVEGINTFAITTYQQAINLLFQGERNRKTAETGMNKESSRSHTIFTVNVESEVVEEEVIKVRRSKINIIDLAGSERVKHTNVEGERLKQGCNINKSLHVLGNVINALVQSTKKKKHIPFRDSKLTYYLKDSLGGNSITRLLANIQCNSKYLGDTLSTLMFAKRAKILKMKVEVNQNAMENYQTLRKEIKKLRQQLAQAKYINQTRLSDRFQTENETEGGIEKFDASNFDSSVERPLQVFEENEMHYKALIEIYEEHMRECNMLNGSNNNENYNSMNGTFAKKKTSNILSHSQWKKLEKKNLALVSLIKRVPAFTKIYRENVLLKQERNEEKKVIKSQRELSFTEHRLAPHSTTLSLEYDSSQLDILQQSFIPNEQQEELINCAVQKAVQQYEQIIAQMKNKFNQCLNELDKSYCELEKQVQEKDKKIKEISKRQLQLPTNIEELIDENQYLKLNILELESQLATLQKQLEQSKIKQRQEGRRYSLFQQPLSNKKITPPLQNNWLCTSLNIKEIESQSHLSNDVQSLSKPSTQQIQKLIENCSQLELVKSVISSLESCRRQALKESEDYEFERESLLDCIQALQGQCKRLMLANKKMFLKNQSLKAQKNTILEEITKTHPQFQVDPSHKLQKMKSMQGLWNQVNKQMTNHQSIEELKKQAQLQTESLYSKLKEMQKTKEQLNQFIVKEKAAEKQFGKSINQILQEYAEMLLNKPTHQSITINSRQNALSSHKMLVSPRSSQFLGKFSSSAMKGTREYLQSTEIQQKRQSARGDSKASQRASQEKRLHGMRSPKK